jgi:uncharacterized protein (DUF952 family)
VSLIYKLLAGEAWAEAQALGVFEGSSVDHADGYIHFSSAGQLAETARRHFHGVRGLLALEVEADELGEPLRWEPSRGGELFPHLYAPLPTTAVRRVLAIELDPDGAPIIGSLEP